MKIKLCFKSSHHQPPHPLLLYTLILLLLLALRVGMVRGHGFGQFLHLAGDGAVVLFEVFGVLQDAVEVLLGGERQLRLKHLE